MMKTQRDYILGLSEKDEQEFFTDLIAVQPVWRERMLGLMYKEIMGTHNFCTMHKYMYTYTYTYVYIYLYTLYLYYAIM